MGLPRVAQTSSLATRLLVPVGIRPGVHCRAVTTQAQGTAHLVPGQLEAPRPQPAGLQAHVSGLLADGLDWPGPGTSRVQSSPAGSTPLGSAGQVPSSILDWIRRRSSSTSCISDSWLRFGLSFTHPTAHAFALSPRRAPAAAPHPIVLCRRDIHALVDLRPRLPPPPYCRSTGVRRRRRPYHRVHFRDFESRDPTTPRRIAAASGAPLARGTYKRRGLPSTRSLHFARQPSVTADVRHACFMRRI